MTDLGYIGKSARVTATIKSGRAGEVILSLPGGGSQTFIARATDSGEEFEEGTMVWVADQSGRTVYVTNS